MQMIKKLPIHIVRLLLILGVFVSIALVAKAYLTDPSFYKYGHYRGDVMPELAAGTPLYKGTPYCRSCHDDALHNTSAGAHASVECEVCHGTDLKHPDNSKMKVPVDTIRLCSACHESMPARPARQPQIVLAEHPFPEDAGAQCHTCHNPHAPSEGPAVAALVSTETEAETGAAIKVEPAGNVPAAVSKCSRCHGKQGEGRGKNPPLAGMQSGEFIKLMNGFKSGAIESKRMGKFARELSDADIIELAGYYAKLPTISAANSAK